MTSETKQRLGILGVVIILAILFLLPTIFKGSFVSTWITKPLGLGLDLSGGVHLVYRVESHEAVKGRIQVIGNTVRSDLRKDKVAITRVKVSPENRLILTLLSSRTVEKVKKHIADEYRDLKYDKQEADGSRVKLSFSVTPQWIDQVERNAVLQALETLRNRVDLFGVSEPLIQRSGVDRIILQMPGVSDIESVKEIVGTVAQLEFRLLPTAQTAPFQVMMKTREGGQQAVEDEVRMTGEAVDDARPVHEQGQMSVSLTLTNEGGRTFRKITTDNVNRQLAIILDGIVYSSPTINEPISGGRASITGGFTLDEATKLSNVLKSGALPAPLTVLEERTVGPTLGQESIEKGIMAIVIGFVLVIVFMVFYYRKAGLLAVCILGLNVVLVIAAISVFGATLTLPGLAGLALTIGMAVDANVIIFERIREEIRNGVGRDAAVGAGFKSALSAIVDSNVTTLLAGVILLYFGTGPVRGFAVTLSMGIMTTLFCATFVSKLMFDVFPLKNSKGNLSI